MNNFEKKSNSTFHYMYFITPTLPWRLGEPLHIMQDHPCPICRASEGLISCARNYPTLIEKYLLFGIKRDEKGLDP